MYRYSTDLHYTEIGCLAHAHIKESDVKLNNGYLVIEAPELVIDLKEKFGTDNLTVKTGMRADIDFVSSVINVHNKKYPISAVGTAAQELILSTGLENWVKERI